MASRTKFCRWASTHCRDCFTLISPTRCPSDTICLGPRCSACKLRQHEWLERHCSMCECDMPYKELAEGAAQVCDACYQQITLRPITDEDIPW